MAGLVPAIDGCSLVMDVDSRDKPGDDDCLGHPWKKGPPHARRADAGGAVTRGTVSRRALLRASGALAEIKA
jgi:hypothetical protein